MDSSGSGVGVERVGTEQLIEGEATRNVLEKQQIRWAKRGDTTPSVLNVERLKFRNTGPVTVVALDDGKPGQSVSILGDGQTTVNHNAKINRASGAAGLLVTGQVYNFTRWDDGVWHESSSSGGGGGGGSGVSSFNTRVGAVVPTAGDYTPAQVGAVPVSHLTDPDPHTQYVLDSEKGASGGIAQLDGSTLVPKAQLGTGVADATKFLRGDGTWQVPAGGTIQIWHWDRPPAAPSAIDDEFNAALAGWTTYGRATTRRIAGSKLEQTLAGSSTSADSGGIERVLPAGNFTVMTRVSLYGVGAFCVGGIFLRNATTGKMKSFTIQLDSVDQRNTGIACANYTAANARSSNTSETMWPGWELFMRISYDGTNLIFEYGKSGTNWSLFLTETVATWFGASLPDRVGLLVDPFSTTIPAKAAFDFLRYYNASQQDTGGFNTVS